MRIVIVGQKWLGAAALELCLRRGDQILNVVTPGAEPGECDRLYAAAQQAGIPVTTARRVAAAHIPAGTDLILSAHGHAYVTAAARAVSRHGALGYHPSLLPRHRGRDAVRWAIQMRDTITGGTLYWMDDGADTGPIAAQDWCHVRPTDTPASLWRRDLAPMGLRLIGRALADLDRGVVTALPQNEACATWEPAFSGGRLAIR
jgi:methionyl-tRNA formyltransferase